MSLTRRLVFGEHPRRTAVRILVLAGIAFITFKWLLIPIRTEGSSMLPTFTPDELRLVNRLAYQCGDRRSEAMSSRSRWPGPMWSM